MDTRARLSPEFRGLLDALLQDRLDPLQQARLEELLTDDAQLRRVYVETMSTVAGIRRYLRGADIGGLRAALGGIEEFEPILHGQPAAAGGSADAPALGAPSSDRVGDNQARPASPIVPQGGVGGIPAPGPLVGGNDAPLGASAAPLAYAPPSARRNRPGLLELIAVSFRQGANLARRPLVASFAVAACCAGALLLTVLLGTREIRPKPLVEPTADEVAGASQASDRAAPTETFVARVVRVSSGVVWGEPKPALDFFLRARAGDKLNVAEGLVQVEFFTGAKIILHGPSVFIPTGPSAGRLESGRLTGEVSQGDFRLVTPTAEVIDLGTAFGVTMDAATGTDVLVFDGRVQAVSRPGGANSGEVLDMTEGMAARFRIDGVTEYGLKTDAKKFTRSMPSSATQENLHEICLIDVLAGGDGLGTHLAGAIDASTGQRDYGEGGRQLEISGRPADGAFHPIGWQPLIDGVFIPRADGLQVQVDSLGHRVDLPANVGWTHGSLWARRRESVLEPTSGLDNDFWGNRTLQGVVKRLKESRLGLLGIHANAGMTFDLRKMQLVHRRPPSGFRAVVANVENSGDWSRDERPEIPAKRTIDFRVFVDGVSRFKRLGFRREDGEQEFTVALSPGDRFLTVIATDDGDIDYDHLVLIDPVITLHQE